MTLWVYDETGQCRGPCLGHDAGEHHPLCVVPTRAMHEREAHVRLTRLLDGRDVPAGLAALVARGVEDAIEREVVGRAALALLGQGGPGDAGGTGAASALPLLPPSPIWRWMRRVGGAWCAALRGVAGNFRLRRTISEDGVYVDAIGLDDVGARLWHSAHPHERAQPPTTLRNALARVLMDGVDGVNDVDDIGVDGMAIGIITVTGAGIHPDVAALAIAGARALLREDS